MDAIDNIVSAPWFKEAAFLAALLLLLGGWKFGIQGLSE